MQLVDLPRCIKRRDGGMYRPRNNECSNGIDRVDSYTTDRWTCVGTDSLRRNNRIKL